jgi:hypothetical protein
MKDLLRADVRSGGAEAIEHIDHSAAVRKIADILDSLRFGSIEIVVHEGRVVHIERREKLRVR